MTAPFNESFLQTLRAEANYRFATQKADGTTEQIRMRIVAMKGFEEAYNIRLDLTGLSIGKTPTDLSLLNLGLQAVHHVVLLEGRCPHLTVLKPVRGGWKEIPLDGFVEIPPTGNKEGTLLRRNVWFLRVDTAAVYELMAWAGKPEGDAVAAPACRTGGKWRRRAGCYLWPQETRKMARSRPPRGAPSDGGGDSSPPPFPPGSSEP